ncbi:hypothetical protein L202_06730 [Cryptococcus amylolentus CBS 6039]|uniref:Uncharacterized protein n=1 Tax=Cryptococcus amylolentus CBS 6039 TaxID=1295533 RepID=A0A1E3HJK8_9TREE|nr:hypothetical protein L202_06730 [Cryptococcus amylolentus CBS 6039]ODN75611.1 hypothetical protein L202_06730 [Cryptococcus amylolentus CBS 6039]
MSDHSTSQDGFDFALSQQSSPRLSERSLVAPGRPARHHSRSPTPPVVSRVPSTACHSSWPTSSSPRPRLNSLSSSSHSLGPQRTPQLLPSSPLLSLLPVPADLSSPSAILVLTLLQ